MRNYDRSELELMDDLERLSNNYCPKCLIRMSQHMHVRDEKLRRLPPMCRYCDSFWTVTGAYGDVVLQNLGASTEKKRQYDEIVAQNKRIMAKK